MVCARSVESSILQPTYILRPARMATKGLLCSLWRLYQTVQSNVYHSQRLFSCFQHALDIPDLFSRTVA